MLSSRLNAFVIPTSQSDGRAAPRSSRSRRSRPSGRPRARSQPRRTALRAWPTPAVPRDRRRSRPGRAACTRRGRPRAASRLDDVEGDRDQHPVVSPAIRPRPPTSGVSRSCQRSSRGPRRGGGRGVIEAPPRSPRTRQPGRRSRQSAITKGKGKGRLLAGCVALGRSRCGRRCSRCCAVPSARRRSSPTDSGSSALPAAALRRRRRDPAHARRPPARDRREAPRDRAWPAKAREEGWYGEDDTTDLLLPAVPWDDPTWSANEHSFGVLLDRYVKPGQRVLEVGAAGWGRAPPRPARRRVRRHRHPRRPRDRPRPRRVLRAHVGPFERVQADGENLPFANASFDLVYCVASLHHALDAGHGQGDGARRARRRVAARTRDARAARAPTTRSRSPRRRTGSTSTCTRCGRTSARSSPPESRSRGSSRPRVRRDQEAAQAAPRAARPLVGRTAATLVTQNLSEYSGPRSSAGDRVSAYADLVRYRELFGSLFRRDLEAKYKGTLLGVSGRSRTRCC